MNEHSYTRAILAKLPSEIHVQSMTGAALNNNGTPDRYIDGPGGDLWVEFKFISRMPKVLRPYDMLSTLQLKWLERRANYGTDNTVVIVGFKVSERKAAGFILDNPDDWRIDHIKAEYSQHLLSNSEVSNYLERRVSL